MAIRLAEHLLNGDNVLEETYDNGTFKVAAATLKELLVEGERPMDVPLKTCKQILVEIKRNMFFPRQRSDTNIPEKLTLMNGEIWLKGTRTHSSFCALKEMVRIYKWRSKR